MNSDVILKDEDVTITATRASFGAGLSLAISQVSAVSIIIDKSNRQYSGGSALAALSVGWICYAAESSAAMAIGALFAALSVALLAMLKPSYVVALSTSSGEQRAFTTKDSRRAIRVKEAIERAIEQRK